MSEPLSDILPAFFVKLKSLSQGWERAIRPRPLPSPFPRVITSYRRSKSRWSTLFTSSVFRPVRDRVNDVSKSPIRRRISTETGNRTQLGDFFFFGKYRARIDEFRKVTREWRFFRDANAKWHVSHSVEKWDFRGRGWRGSTSVFDERRVVTRRSALERVFFFFFWREALFF